MLTVLDTNTLVRFFTNDIPHKVDKIEKLLQEEKQIINATFTSIEVNTEKAAKYFETK